MDDDAIADITATLRFDRAILLFWFYLSNNQLVTFILQFFFVKSLTCKDSFSIFAERIFIYGKM
jgi:hypothetical protein